MDRIMHDDVFRLNLILNGGWTKDTFHILEELIELALKQKEWNKRFGHLSCADRKNITNEEPRDLRTKDAALTSSRCDQKIVYTPLGKRIHHPQV